MAPQKSPAFQFYARDFLTGVATMSLAERGAYISLLAHQWDAGMVPNSSDERARILGCTKAQEKTIWQQIGKKFAPVDGGYQNSRLEEERSKQAEYRRRQSDKGKAGAKSKWQPSDSTGNGTGIAPVMPVPLPVPQPNDGSSSAFAFASAVRPKEQDVTPPRPIISGEANPRTWGKLHGEHVTGFCDWVCLPEFLFAEFSRKSAKGDASDAYVREWAHGVRRRCEGQAIGDNLKFWRAQWDAFHPVVKPEPKPFSIADALARKAAER